jgi:predicted nucleotidyltransferase
VNVEARDFLLKQVKQTISPYLYGTSAQVYLFGSWARTEEKRSSDIDIAVEFKTSDASHYRTLMNIRHALEESTIPYRIDVVHMNEADSYIVNKVREEGILWDVPSNE